MILWGYLLSLLYAALVLGIGALCYKLGLDKKYSRKIVHILVGLEWFILSATHTNTIHFVIVCLFFVAFLTLVYHKRWLPMISSAEDNAKGTVFYAISMTAMATVSLFFADFLPAFGIAVLATSFGDGFGGIFGQALGKKHRLYKNKTLVGTLAVFVATLGSVSLFSHGYGLGYTLVELLCISLLAAGVELLATRGLDNILVPLSVSAFAYLLYLNLMDSMMLAISVAPLLVALTRGRDKLTRGGAITACALDVLVAIAFGDRGFWMLIAFFALALIADEVKRMHNPKKEKSECRNASQVLANSAFGALCALSYIIFSHKYFLFLYLLSFAEALADTASSGFGILARNTYDIFRFRKIEKGESGGISLVGTLAGLFFSATLLALGALLFSLDLSVLTLLLLCATAGNLFDSFLGTFVQLRYRCAVCQRVVEEPVHCEESAEHIRGVRPFDNSLVNLMSVAFSIALFCLITFFL